MKFYEAVASSLVAEDVTDIFGVMGDHNMMMWSTIASTGGSRIYHARNEAGAVAMADGYFRSSGKIGVCTTIGGPGLTQCGTSLVAAGRNRSPLLLITGEIATVDRHHIHCLDQRRFTEACEAQYVEVRSSDTAAETIAEAFRLARKTPGPVVLSFPVGMLGKDLEMGWDYLPAHGSGVDISDAASEEAVERLYQTVISAESPILIAGQGAKRSEAFDDLIELGDRTGALLATSLQAKGFFSGEEYDIGISGTYASAVSEELFQEADLVIGVGAELGYYTSEGGLLFPEAKVVRIDVKDPKATIIPQGVHIKGDAAKTIRSLNAKLSKAEFRKEGFRKAATKEMLHRSSYEYETPDDGIDPRAAARTLSERLPHSALLVCGNGHFSPFPGMHMAVPRTVDVFFTMQFGAVGQALPTALGIGMAQPSRPLVVIEGDGSLFMNVQELDAVVQAGRQMLLIVWNDCGFGAEVHKFRARNLDAGIASWKSPDFSSVAKGFGGDGRIVRSIDDLGDAITDGLQSDGLFVIDARMSPSEICDPYNKVHFGVPTRAPLLRFSPAPLK